MKTSLKAIVHALNRKNHLILLSAFTLFFSFNSFAHRVETYTTSGCFQGQSVTIDALITFAPSSTRYQWQFRDNSGNWRCFINGTNTTAINGIAFTVSGATGTGANNAPLLTISRADGNIAALENVQVRVIMRENIAPVCANTAIGHTLTGDTWGGDDQNKHETKYLRLHVYASSNDCGGSTPGCLGNMLMNARGFYGGFENKVYNASGDNYTDYNFSAAEGAGSSDFTRSLAEPTANSYVLNANSGTGTGQYLVVNNPYYMNTGFTANIGPRTGNFQMAVRGNTNPASRAWYKTISVVPGATYSFCVWAARLDATVPTISINAGSTELNAVVLSGIGIWQQLCGSYQVPAGVTSIVFAVKDKNAAAGAHNYALDDICIVQAAPPAAVGDRVWVDANGNGMQDGTEKGQGGVKVKLYKPGITGPCGSDAVLVDSAVTDGNGLYLISNIPAAVTGTSYFIRFSGLPGNTFFTVKNAAGSTSANNSDATNSTGCTDVFSLLAGQTRLDIDAGISTPGGGSLPLHSMVLSLVNHQNSTVTLHWLAENEMNTRLFVVERSVDGLSFEETGQYNVTGPNNTLTNYTGTDDIRNLQVYNTIYYRVAAVDDRGRKGYSNVISLRLNKTSAAQVWPNPFSQQLNIQVNVLVPGALTVYLRNVNGQVVKTSRFNASRGVNFLFVRDLDNLPAGMYLAEIRSEKEVILTQKMIKQ
jgi:SdrD B-like domain/Secretion system C-terminal sorting domain